MRCASFQPFRPPAVAQQAPPAIISQAVRRFRGALLSHRSRPSSKLGFPVWPLGLTVRRSRPPTAASELKALVPLKTRFIWPMLFQPAFSFSGVIQRLACRFSGLRLWALRQFSVFLAASAFPASATRYLFASVAPLPWRSAFSWVAPFSKSGRALLAFGSNCSSQPTAYGGV